MKEHSDVLTRYLDRIGAGMCKCTFLPLFPHEGGGIYRELRNFGGYCTRYSAVPLSAIKASRDFWRANREKRNLSGSSVRRRIERNIFDRDPSNRHHHSVISFIADRSLIRDTFFYFSKLQLIV